MNKKRLSVVMAGAMLASSVAPVLAAEETTVEKVEVNKGALINELTAKIWNAPRFNADSKDTRVATDLKGASIYGIKIGDTVTSFQAQTNESTGSESALQAEIKRLVENKKAGDVVKLVDLGSRLVDGENVYVSTTSSEKYTEGELKYTGVGTVQEAIDTLEALNANIVDVDNSKYENGAYTITFESDTKLDPIKLTTKSDRLDFTRYLSAASNKYETIVAGTQATDFKGFEKADAVHTDIPASTKVEYTVVSGGDTFKLEDLYDGLYLTTKGEEILNSSKEAYADYVKKFGDDATEANKAKHVVYVYDDNSTVTDITSDANIGNLKADDSLKVKDGKYSVTIKILSKVGTAVDSGHTYANEFHVTSTNRPQLERFVRWIDGASAEVEVIAGEDRYATAVKLAKEVELKTLEANDQTNKFNIVLVNGNSLVDGLAAAPLAQHLAKEAGATDGNAPILLTEKNSLPSATKRYLRELIDSKANKEITVSIVGGEGVVSNNVRKQLRELGLNVERYGGEDREATSMAVANEIGFENGAFVVGATGEADAMSISGIAASKVAPVVVSGFEGLSEETIDALDGAKIDIVGGDSKISVAEEEELNAIAERVHRISGSDRKETNAKVIETFYKGSFAKATQSVIVAKDDVLVDALTAANLSVVDNAPIVLGTNSLSASQKEAIAYNAGSAKKIYQMSRNVAREVTKAVAQALKLS